MDARLRVLNIGSLRWDLIVHLSSDSRHVSGVLHLVHLVVATPTSGCLGTALVVKYGGALPLVWMLLETLLGTKVN